MQSPVLLAVFVAAIALPHYDQSVFQNERVVANLIYWAIAGPVGLVGLWFIVRGLFHDRAKGRPRCPKCLYDLTARALAQPDALPMDCPECGRVIRKHWQLFMTRPHKRITTLGLILLIGCLYGSQVRHRVQEGDESFVTAIVPTTYWIVVSPSSSEEVFNRVVDRAWPYRWGSEGDALWFWQRALLVKASHRILQKETGSFAASAMRVQFELAKSSDAALASIIEALGSRDLDIRRQAMYYLPVFAERSWPAWRQVTAILISQPSLNAFEEQCIVRVLGAVGTKPFQEMSDETLCGVARRMFSFIPNYDNASVLNMYLLEMARRRTASCIELLRTLIDDHLVNVNAPPSRIEHPLFSFEMLTVLCRCLGESDPVALRVVSPQGELRATTKALPKVVVELHYARPPKHLVSFEAWNEPANWNKPEKRNLRFRFEVRDEAGQLIPPKAHHFSDVIPGSTQLLLSRDVGYRTTLDMNHHLPPLKPGRYNVIIHYSNSLNISGMADISQAITIAAVPFELVVE